MVLVLVFLALVMAAFSMSQRHIAAALRIETVRTLPSQRDEGGLQALAHGLALLETGSPPSDPYVCAVTMNTSTGPRTFTVTLGRLGPHRHRAAHGALPALGKVRIGRRAKFARAHC